MNQCDSHEPITDRRCHLIEGHTRSHMSGGITWGDNDKLTTTVSRRIEWDMGHRIPDHQSLCKHPHGHRYVAEITVEGPVIEKEGSPERGMVKDFSILKHVLRFIPNRWDHSFMVFKEDPFAAALALFEKNHFMDFVRDEGPMRMVQVDFIPTAENIAAEIFRQVQKRDFNIVEVVVWETPNCKATVRG